MSTTAVIINLLALAGLGIAALKDTDRAVGALRIAARSLVQLIPTSCITTVCSGVLLGLLTADKAA